MRVARHLFVRILPLLSNLQCDSLRMHSEIRPCFVDEVTSARVGGGIVCAHDDPHPLSPVAAQCRRSVSVMVTRNPHILTIEKVSN